MRWRVSRGGAECEPAHNGTSSVRPVVPPSWHSPVRSRTRRVPTRREPDTPARPGGAAPAGPFSSAPPPPPKDKNNDRPGRSICVSCFGAAAGQRKGRGGAHAGACPKWIGGGGAMYPSTPPPPCDIPSGCCFFTGPWTVTRSSLRMLRLGRCGRCSFCGAVAAPSTWRTGGCAGGYGGRVSAFAPPPPSSRRPPAEMYWKRGGGRGEGLAGPPPPPSSYGPLYPGAKGAGKCCLKQWKGGGGGGGGLLRVVSRSNTSPTPPPRAYADGEAQCCSRAGVISDADGPRRRFRDRLGVGPPPPRPPPQWREANRRGQRQTNRYRGLVPTPPPPTPFQRMRRRGERGGPSRRGCSCGAGLRWGQAGGMRALGGKGHAPGQCLCRPPALTRGARRTSERSGNAERCGAQRAKWGSGWGISRGALEGEGPQRRPQQRLGRRLEEVAKAVGGGYCRLLNAVEPGAWRQGDSGWAPWSGGGGGTAPPFQCISWGPGRSRLLSPPPRAAAPHPLAPGPTAHPRSWTPSAGGPCSSPRSAPPSRRTGAPSASAWPWGPACGR